MHEQAVSTPTRPKRGPGDGRTVYVGPNDTVIHLAELYAEVASGRSTQAAIAKRLGLSEPEISRKFSEAGFPRISRKGRRTGIAAE
ncbi:hypothetical protein D3869_01545 [Azospirillum brasilense]|uniref:Uncharacterized protein n=1 Tax=Azospirillum brasilense TaxID=192 RepID=A0A4D8R4G4_AZOBR|nr:hypothetical protein D3869_01545 [Azospirillum brasilense]